MFYSLTKKHRCSLHTSAIYSIMLAYSLSKFVQMLETTVIYTTTTTLLPIPVNLEVMVTFR